MAGEFWWGFRDEEYSDQENPLVQGPCVQETTDTADTTDTSHKGIYIINK